MKFVKEHFTLVVVAVVLFWIFFTQSGVNRLDLVDSWLSGSPVQNQ